MTARVFSVVPRLTRTLVEDLRELVSALDRRMPRLEHDGERAIARDAAALRAQAVKRIAELEADAPVDAAADHVRP